MESHTVKVLSTRMVTHDVINIKVEKPANYSFTPGQATEVAINKKGWDKENRPFTFTNLPTDNHLEFVIKTYPSRKGVTNELLSLVPNDELILHDVWGAIHYKGPGVFIAGGAGITPFLAIFRHLARENAIDDNVLIFGNKKKEDIILEEELKGYLGDRMINVLSDEDLPGFRHGFISDKILKEIITDFDKDFYVCGPPPMMDLVMKSLKDLGVSEKSVTVEI